METTITNQKNKNLVSWVVLSTIFGFVAIVCFILHLSPKEIAELLSEFAKHHYFLAGFISLSVALMILKFYLDNTVITKPRGNGYPVQILQRTRRRKMKVLYQNFKRSIDHHATEPQSIFTKKEEILNLKLQVNEVLPDAWDRELRWSDLQTGLSLGNLYKQKVIICFYDGAIKKHTLATIWQLDSDNVSLKGGAVLPVKNIYKIEL